MIILEFLQNGNLVIGAAITLAVLGFLINVLCICGTGDKNRRGDRIWLSGLIWMIAGLLLGVTGYEFHKVALYEKIEYSVESVLLLKEDDSYYFQIDTGAEEILLRHIPHYSQSGNNTVTELERYEECDYIILYYNPEKTDGTKFEDYSVSFGNEDSIFVPSFVDFAYGFKEKYLESLEFSLAKAFSLIINVCERTGEYFTVPHKKNLEERK